MEFSFRGPPAFWEEIIAMANVALEGGTAVKSETMDNDPAATSDYKITFIGDPVGDGIAMLFMPSDTDHEPDITPWIEIADRVANA